jgi:hypothetical protein
MNGIAQWIYLALDEESHYEIFQQLTHVAYGVDASGQEL